MQLQSRSRLAFASIIAIFALFLAFGGGAYAATKIDGKRLKARSVAAKKIKVNTLTGNEINESTLGTVPRASAATHADTASTVGGVSLKGFHYQTIFSGGKQTLFSLEGLTLTATCSSGRVDAQTSVDNSYISSSWVTPGGVSAGASDTDFDVADGAFLVNTTTAAETGTVEYVRPDGGRVSVSLQADMASNCTVSGHAMASD